MSVQFPRPKSHGHFKQLNNAQPFMDSLLILLVFASVYTTAGDNLPAVGGEESGFWFGTQSLLCLTSPSHVAINNRNANRFKRQASISRADWHYIHRLIYYKQHVFEWGAGARGYYVGPHAAVTDCPTTWEVLPAGHSTCSIEQLRLFATSYKRTYGGYNLLANNCHHFANRAALLLLRNCTETSTDDVTNTSATTTASSVRSEITSWAWNAMKWILSHVTSDTEP